MDVEAGGRLIYEGATAVSNTSGAVRGVAADITGTPTSISVTENYTAGTKVNGAIYGIELGHATDTTVTRGAAGQMNIEGVRVLTASNAVSVTNKSLRTIIGILDFTAAAELTIASGVITATQTVHRIDTEADGATDDLDTTAGRPVIS